MDPKRLHEAVEAAASLRAYEGLWRALVQACHDNNENTLKADVAKARTNTPRIRPEEGCVAADLVFYGAALIGVHQLLYPSLQ